MNCLAARLGMMALCLLGGVRFAEGTIPSGNEYALRLVEAKSPAARKEVLAEGVGKQHFFRYLYIKSIEHGEAGGCPFISLVTREPSSEMTIRLKVEKSLSMAILLENPPSDVGDAVAVVGYIKSADPVKKEMVLGPVIVRFKDILAPKAGKEMLSEIDSSAIVYSFTGWKEPVNVTKRDEDLVKDEEAMIKKLGKEGFAKYLLAELAKRDKAAKDARNKLNIYKKRKEPEAGSVPTVPTQSVITEDEE